MTCPQCRADVPAGARYCPACGHELLVVGDQRRIATVLFADLVGFTSLAELRDPEQVKGLVDRCFDRLVRDVEAFGGRVDKVLGDAIIALFGAPVAHEDDAERAVRAGLRMQETVTAWSLDIGVEIKMRVGINTGMVVVGAVSGGREYTAMGDVVNTASRLQAAATPGTVLVGGETHAATAETFAYEAVAPVVLRGKEAPVEAWVALHAVAPPGHRPRRKRSPLIGRDTELALLGSVLDTAIDRHRAALLLIHGEAGMGKSRLAEEAADHTRCEFDTLVLEGRCVPYGEANVWWPVAEAVRSAAAIPPDADLEQTTIRLRRAVSIALESSGRTAEVERVLSGLLHLLGHEGSLRGIDASRAREEAVRAVVALTEGYSRQRPVAIVLSDLHWADDEVLDLVDTLLVRLARRPFALIATARRSLRERWHPTAEAANTVVLHLDPLSSEASRRLLHTLTEGAIHPALADLIVERAGGNPFYLEELVSLIGDAGVRSVEQLVAGEAGELPGTLRGLVAARLDGLPAAERAVLDDAAVLGRSSKISAIVTMAVVKRGIDEEQARQIVEALGAREFLILEDDEYTFRSEVIREVAYSTLTKADRARSHAGIAKWMVGHENVDHDAVIDQVANHLACAAELTREIGRVSGIPEDIADEAVAWLRKAADQADLADLPGVAVTLATRALRLLDDSHPARHIVLRRRGAALAQSGRFDEALADAEDSLRLASEADDAHGVARAILLLGDIAQKRGSYGEAIRLLADARERYLALGDKNGQGDALRLVGLSHLLAGEHEPADEALREALECFEAVGDRRGVAWTLQNLAWSAYTAGRVAEAEARIEVALRTFEELGDVTGTTWSKGLLGWVRFHQGRNDEAAEIAREVAADAAERGERWGQGMMLTLSSMLALWAGRTEEAVTESRAARDLFLELDDNFGSVQARGNLGRALIMAGHVAEGRAELDDVMSQFELVGAEDGPDRRWFARIAAMAAAVQLGEVDYGASIIGDDDDTPWDDFVGGPDRAVAIALHHLQRGDGARALEIARAMPVDNGYPAAARALCEGVAGDPRAAEEAAALSTGSVTHTYLDRAYASLGQAMAAFRTGDVDRARSVLADTIAVVDATGDRLAQVVVRLADAQVAEAARRPDAASARQVAENRLADLGIEAAGWRRVFADATGLVARH